MLHKPALWGLRMKRTCANASPVWCSNGDVKRRHPAVLSLGDVVDNLVKATRDKISKLHLYHRLKPFYSQPHSCAQSPGLNNRGIADAIFAKLLNKAFRYFKNPAVLSNILSHDDKLIIFLESLF